MTDAHIETPKEAARRFSASAIAQGYKPEGLHEYRGIDGKPLYWRIRAKRAPDEKWIRPMRFNGNGYELGEPEYPKGGKPLYHLDRICADVKAPVWICEGEKACDALAKLDAVTTTSGSAQSAAGADWTVLRGRECRLWPDNDKEGKSYAGEVGNILVGLGCALSCVDVAKLDLPAKGDAYDWAQRHENATLDDLEALPRLAHQPPARNATGAREAGADAGELVLLRASEIVPQPIRWLWRDRIALGKVTLIAGDPGLGKSLVTIALAAHVTTARPWPVDGTACERGDVILMSAEDDAADTLRPRLDAAGADVERVSIVKAMRIIDRDTGKPEERMFSLRRDLDAVCLAALRLPECRLIVIDPISAYLDGTESHNNTEVRAVLAPLATLAAEVGAAIVCVTHLNKGSQSSALYRAMGSLAFVAAARAAFAVIRDKDDPARRLILPMKNNLAADATGVAYSVVAPHGTPLVAWEAEPVIITADEALAPERRDGDGQERDRPERDDAVRWLRDLLTDGPRSAKEVQHEARAANISLRTLRRAKVELPIDTYKEGFGPTGTWVWRLEGVHVSPSNVATGHLNGGPHATDLPAKAATGHLSKGDGGHLSGQSSAGDDREEFTL